MKIHPKFVGFIALMLLVNLLWMNHATSLWDEDEAAYAGFGIEMIESGDWVNPEYQWSTIHRKTPFHFWSIAVSYKIFGVNEFAVRMPSVLAVLLTCLLLFLLGRPLFGEKNAKRAAIILATSVQLPLMGKIAFTDATLLLSQTIAVLSLLNFLYRPSWKWNLGLWFGIALGVLVKGPPIILLTGGIWLLLALFHPQRKNLIKTHPWFFGLLALLPFAWWCYLSYMQDYALWQELAVEIPFEEWWQEAKEGRKIHLLPFLWDWYVMSRINGSVLGQSGFPGYHFVVLTIAFLTWLPFWFLTIGAAFKNFIKPTDKQLILTVWIVLGWFFWELMSSKLPSYSMGAQPALALLMALQISKLEKEEIGKRWLNIGLGFYVFIFSIVIIALPIAGYLFFGAWTFAYLIPMSLVLLVLLVRLLKGKEGIEQLYQNTAIFGAVFMFLVWACVSPIVEQSPAKSFDNIVETAYEESGQNKDARVILCGLDIKQLKISLLVYAQAQFGKYEEMYVPEAMAAFKSEEPTVLIIGTTAIEAFKKEFEKANIPFDAKEIQHRSLDHNLKEHNFWVIGNGK